MDERSITKYNQKAKEKAKSFRAVEPAAAYELISEYFIAGGVTLDVGCGSGRDTAWLNKRGYTCTGVDASEGMIKEAREYYPRCSFFQDYLPELKKIQSESFDNILAQAVLMHLPQEHLRLAILSLLRILKKEGVLILSYRMCTNDLGREDEILYSKIDEQVLSLYYNELGELVLHKTISNDETRPMIKWYNIVATKLIS